MTGVVGNAAEGPIVISARSWVLKEVRCLPRCAGWSSAWGRQVEDTRRGCAIDQAMHEAKAGDVAPMSKILDVVAVTGTDDPHGLVLDDVKGLELVVGASLPDGTQVFHPGANVGFVESGESRASDEGAGAVKQGEGSFGVSGDALNVGAP